MRPLRRFDYRLTTLIQAWNKSWRPLMAGVSFLGLPSVVLAVGLVGFVSATWRAQPEVRRAFFLGAIAYGINTVLKLLLRRQRPHNLNVTTFGLRSYSFPSGHAFGTVIFYGLLAYLDYTILANPWRWLIAGLLGLLVFFIGLSRVYLKAHYPSDVVGGWLLGAISLLIIVRLAF
jgi:membrane-associated phospholipid phosphatase